MVADGRVVIPGAGALLALALALLLWPARPHRMSQVGAGVGATVRGRALAGRAWWIARLSRRAAARRPVERRGTPGHGRAGPALGLAGVVVALAVVISWPVALAAGVLAGTVRHLLRRARRAAGARAALAAAAAALRALARDLQAGTPPADAIRAVTGSAPPGVAAVLAGLPGGPTLPPAYPARGAAPSAELSDARSRLRMGWELSVAHGIPLAAVTSALADDLADRTLAVEGRVAQVAGPAVSGYVLSALPAAGPLLGAGMGADPLGVLLGSTVGGVLLVVGTVLCCAGLAWADRIVRG